MRSGQDSHAAAGRCGGAPPRPEYQPRQQRVAELAGIDDGVVGEPAGRALTDALACSAAKRARSSGSATALASERAGSAPRVIEGKARVMVWPSNGFIAMIDEPKPNALRRVTWSLGTVSRCCTANMRAA